MQLPSLALSVYPGSKSANQMQRLSQNENIKNITINNGEIKISQ